MAEYVVIDKEQLESDLTTVADAIREKGGTSEPLAFPLGMKSAVDAIQSGGEDNARYAKSISFDENFLQNKITLTLEVVTSLNDMFLNCPNLEEVTINCSNKVTNIRRFFYGSKNYQKIKKLIFNVDTSQVTDMYQAFSFLVGNNDVEIVGEIDFTKISNSANVNYIFYLSRGLKEVRFAKGTLKVSLAMEHCNVLSDASIQSIIDGLAIVETSQIITWHKDIEAKLSEEQKAQITSKNWTIAFK